MYCCVVLLNTIFCYVTLTFPKNCLVHIFIMYLCSRPTTPAYNMGLRSVVRYPTNQSLWSHMPGLYTRYTSICLLQKTYNSERCRVRLRVSANQRRWVNKFFITFSYHNHTDYPGHYFILLASTLHLRVPTCFVPLCPPPPHTHRVECSYPHILYVNSVVFSSYNPTLLLEPTPFKFSIHVVVPALVPYYVLYLENSSEGSLKHTLHQCSGSGSKSGSGSTGTTCFWASRMLLSASKNSRKNLDFIFEKWCKCIFKKYLISRKTFKKLAFCLHLGGQWRK